MKTTSLVGALGSILLLSVPPATYAQFASYPDPGSWSAAVSGVSTVAVTGDKFAYLGAGSSVSATYSGVGFSANSAIGAVAVFGGAGEISSEMQNVAGTTNLLITFPSPVYGFSLNYGTVTYANYAYQQPEVIGSVPPVNVALSNGDKFVVPGASSGTFSFSTPGFVGITDTTPFTSVLLTAAYPTKPTDLTELNVGNISYAVSPVSATPVVPPAGYLPNLLPSSVLNDRSLNGDTATSITFTNAYWNPVTIYWLDYSGVRQRYAQLNPGRSYTQQTFLTHPWIVTDNVTNDDLVAYLPQQSPAIALIGVPQGTPANIPHSYTSSPGFKLLTARVSSFHSLVDALCNNIFSPAFPCRGFPVVYYATLSPVVRAGDPPDPNYSTISPAAFVAPPPLTAQSGVSSQQLSLLNALQTLGAEFLGVANAEEVSLNRADAALAAGQTQYYDAQVSAAVGFENQEALLSARLSNVLRKVDLIAPDAGWAAVAADLDAANPAVGTQPPGDLNADGLITCADLAIIKASFGKTLAQASFDARSDVNSDGVINILDLSSEAKLQPAGTQCPQ